MNVGIIGAGNVGRALAGSLTRGGHGDDGDGKADVLDLIESVGFHPIDVGPLSVARTLEAMGWLNIQLQIQDGWPWQGGWKFAGPSGTSTPTVSEARR